MSDDGTTTGTEAAKDAYAELSSVIERVSEQLARFRRRALSAEAQLRDVEQRLAAVEATAQAEQAARAEERDAAAKADAEQRAARRAAERGLAEERARRAELESALVAAETRLASLSAGAHGAAGAVEAAPAARAPRMASALPADENTREELVRLAQENATLRARLEDATSRTRGMLDRVRFLRQQVGVTEDAR